MKTIPLIFGLLILASCATRTEKKEIQQKVANESEISDGKSLVRSVNDDIHTSKTLSGKQKLELQKILDRVKATNSFLIEQSFKQKGALIKEILSGKKDKRQVSLLKRDIRKTESLRLKNTLAAFNEIANVISGDPESQAYLEHVMHDRAIR